MSANINDTKDNVEKTLLFHQNQPITKKAPKIAVVKRLELGQWSWVYRDKRLLTALLDKDYVMEPKKRELPRSKSWPGLKVK